MNHQTWHGTLTFRCISSVELLVQSVELNYDKIHPTKEDQQVETEYSFDEEEQ